MFDFRSIIRRADRNPASRLFATRRGVTDLGTLQGPEAHGRLLASLRDLHTSSAPMDRDRLGTLSNLEEHGAALQEDLITQYFQNTERASGPHWKRIFALYWLLAHNYQALLRAAVTTPGNSALAGYLPKLTLRTLNYFRMEVKWDYLRGQKIRPHMWRRLHALLRIAEQGGFADQPAKLADGRISSCHDEYVWALLLDLIGPTELPATHLETAARWMEAWSGLVRLKNIHSPGTHSHCVDLGSEQGAGKAPEFSGVEKHRYWSMTDLLAEAYRLKSRIAEQASPALLAQPESLALLDHMVRSWMWRRPIPRQELLRGADMDTILAPQLAVDRTSANCNI